MSLKVYQNKYRNPVISAEQDYRDVFDLKEVTDIDYIKDHILYRHRQLLENDGETFQIWRKKRQGDICDNTPDCPFGNDQRQAPNPNCPRCFGTGFIGGYDYSGETLIRYAPETLNFTIAPGGVLKAHNPFSWTFPEPVLFNFDILIAVDQPRLVQEQRVVDNNLYRDITKHAHFDSLDDGNNVVRILKISNKANYSADYKEGIDYALSNNGVLWLQNSGSKRPDDLSDYYVTYQKADTYLRRYEASNVKKSNWRGVTLHQELTLNELEVNHSAYRAINTEPYDPNRFYYPFPYSVWYDRKLGE